MRIAAIILILVVGIAGYSSVYTVHQRQQALVLQFGQVKQFVEDPGFHIKIPFVQNVVYFDRRVLDFDARAEEVPTKDQKQVVVDAFARYRIVDPLEFFKTVTNEEGMASRLNTVINSALRAAFGEVDLALLLTPERAKLIARIADRVKIQAKGFGIDVIDVRVLRLDLPEENSQAIFRRMETQRKQEAIKIRAEGDKESKRIHAEADKQVRIIKALAEKKSQILRGEGEGQAQRIYNAAFGRDPKFFDFWVSMNALRTGLTGSSTRYIGPPTGDFFRFFSNMDGTRSTPPKR